MIRTSVYVQGNGNLKVTALGSKPTRFIAVELEELTIYFSGYGLDNVRTARIIALALNDAANELETLHYNDMSEHDHEMEKERTPQEAGLCCMARHANAVPPWTCDCLCHTAKEKDSNELGRS